MKATVKELKNALANNKSTFIGIVRAPWTLEEITAKLTDFLDINKRGLVEVRTAKKVQSNAVQFNNDSWIYFNDKTVKKSVEKATYTDGALYAFYEWYDKDCCTVMVYYVYNQIEF